MLIFWYDKLIHLYNTEMSKNDNTYAIQYIESE